MVVALRCAHELWVLLLVLMADPNWNNGFYYDGLPPHTGMKLARRMCPRPCRTVSVLTQSIIEIATITYRSGPEWDQRFGRKMRPLPEAEQSEAAPSVRVPALCPDFLIETYLDYQVRLSVSPPHAPLTRSFTCRANNSASNTTQTRSYTSPKQWTSLT